MVNRQHGRALWILTVMVAIALTSLGTGGENRVSGVCRAEGQPRVEVLTAEVPDGWTTGPTPKSNDGPCLVLLPKGKTEATTDKAILVQYQDRVGSTNLTNIKDYARLCATALMTGHPDLFPRAWDPAAPGLKGHVLVSMELVDNAANRAATSTSHRLLIVEVRDGWYAVDASATDPGALPTFTSFFRSLRID